MSTLLFKNNLDGTTDVVSGGVNTLKINQDKTLATATPSNTMSGNNLATVGQIPSLVVTSISGLLTSDTSKVVNVLNYHTGLEGGGGVFYWDASKPKSEHNGGTVIDPAKVFPTDWNNQTQLANWFTTGSSGTGCWVRQYDGAVNVRWFGAKGDGISDDFFSTIGIVRSFKAVYLPTGTYFLGQQVILEGLENVVFFGDGAELSVLKWNTGRFAVKSPYKVTFKDLTFYPNEDDVVQNELFVSNSSEFVLDSCTFRGFGTKTTITKGGSTCIYIYAGDLDTDTTSAGDSSNTLINNCKFFGSARRTNFGVRVYTEFSGGVAKNTGCLISNCIFEGFNWNAVEIAGTNTSNVVVSDCVANACGLCPFDIDKGASHCTVTDVTINRLLGNVDTNVNSDTRAAICAVQGYLPSDSSKYARYNVIQNVTAYILASDVAAYNRDIVAVSVAYAEHNLIKNVVVHCDSVPTRGTSGSAQIGFGVVAFETAGGNVVRDVHTVNATAGIVQTASTDANMIEEKPNIFENITNDGVMTAEAILAVGGVSTGGKMSLVFKGLKFTTNLTNPRLSDITSYVNDYVLAFQCSGSSVHYARVEDSSFKVLNNTAYFLLHAMPKIGLNNIVIDDDGGAIRNRFVSSEGSTAPVTLGLNSILENYGQTPLDISNALQYLDQTCAITRGVNDYGLNLSGASDLYSSTAPNFPPAGYWHTKKINVINYTAGGTEGWVNTGAAWKTFGTISA